VRSGPPLRSRWDVRAEKEKARKTFASRALIRTEEACASQASVVAETYAVAMDTHGRPKAHVSR
jgi:hypothetical protein